MTFPSIYDPAMRTMIAFGGKYPTTVIPSTAGAGPPAPGRRGVPARTAGRGSAARGATAGGRADRTGSMTGFAHLAAAGPLLVALGLSRAGRAGVVRVAVRGAAGAGYLSYLAAVVGVDERGAAGAVTAPPAARWRVAGSAALFVAGFTAVFVLGTVAVLGMTTTLITNQVAAAAGRRRADHRDGAGVRGLHPGAAAPGPVQPAAADDGGGRAAAGCGVRARAGRRASGRR